MSSVSTSQETTWLSTSEAAALIGVHPNTIRGWIKSGRLPAYDHGSVYKLTLADVQAYIDATRTTPEQEATP